MNILENDYLKVTISNTGAEIRSVYDKKDQRERMWSGDESHWNRVSPVLFPIVGKVKEGFYEIDGERYELSQHGFLRDQQFGVIEERADLIKFAYISDEAMLRVYPYKHMVLITYQLIKSSVKVVWSIYNLDDKTMHYSIGAHPSFLIDEKKDYEFSYPNETRSYSIGLKEGHVFDAEKIQLENDRVVPEFFANNAVIYQDLSSVILSSTDGSDYVKVNFAGFPFVGLWSPYYKDKTIAPFVCIEPWLGIADEYDSDHDFVNKIGMMELPIGEFSHHGYEMTFHEQ
ncbi:aldose 1-epimerase family protein [Erysipelothrix urinaevulpis]|uniref:aldose 1-epimerase family protein n=1 Tax=Erysipelothrix urinaevulpis TaxID=2683717 RepID=UPI00135B9A78|nr:aldose 1-epimerase family protein [Erysipelothrix urinaevulpis]